MPVAHGLGDRAGTPLHHCPLTTITTMLSLTGKGEAIEAILAALEVVSEPFRSFANTLVDICAYAGELGCSGSGRQEQVQGPLPADPSPLLSLQAQGMS